MYVETQRLLGLTPLEWEMFEANTINQKRITLGKEVGKGQFGKVYKGILKDHPIQGCNCEVAIKIPKIIRTVINPGEGDMERLKDIYKEAQIAFELDHKNILRCLGICNGNPINSQWKYHLK